MSEENKNLIMSLKINKVFKSNINQVWNFISNVNKTYESLKDYRSEAIFTKGKESTEVGAEFNFVWKKFLTLYFRIDEVLDKPNYKKLRMKIIKTEPVNITYEYIYHFYPITEDNTTLVLWEWIYESEGYPMSPNEVEMLKNERNRMLDIYENYIINNTSIVVQCESTTISCSAKKVFKAISNPFILFRMTPSIADRYECEGDCSLVGSILKLIKDGICIDLRVIRSDYDESMYNYHLICDNASPKQELRFEIYNISEKQCFLYYSHKFYQHVDQKLLDNVSEEKVKVLKSIKSFFEILSK